jgi:hypothetical protein
MRQRDALLLLACVARSTWSGELDSAVSSDEVACEWVKLTGETIRAQTMGGRLAELARAGLLDRRREGGTNGDHGWTMWTCSRNVRELVKAIDADQRARPARVV